MPHWAATFGGDQFRLFAALQSTLKLLVMLLGVQSMSHEMCGRENYPSCFFYFPLFSSYCVDTRGWWQFSHATLWHYYDSGLSRMTVLLSQSRLKYSYLYALEIQCESLENVLGTKAKFLGHQQAFLCYPFKCQII